MDARESERTYILGGHGQGRDVRTRARRKTYPPRVHQSFVVLVVVMLGRIGKVGLGANLVQYLDYHRFLEWSTATATVVALLSVTTLPRIGAVISGALADARFGHYKVLLISLLLQFTGSFLLLISVLVERSVDKDDEYVMAFRGILMSGLIIFAFGLAGSAGTEVPLGVNQYALRGDDVPTAKVFFPRYYWFVNLGSLIGATVVSTLQANYHLGYSIPPACYLLSILTLLAFRKHLLDDKCPSVDAFRDIWAVTKDAFRTRWLYGKRNMDQAADFKGSLAPWARYAEESQGGTFDRNTVARVHNFMTVVAIVGMTMFPLIIMSQTQTTFTSQGNLMKLPLRTGLVINSTEQRETFTIPPALFQGFNTLGCLLAIPLLYKWLYPQWQTCSGGTPPSLLKRIKVGMVVAILAITAAAIVEVERTADNRYRAMDVTDADNVTLEVSDVLVFYQIPQYILSGVAEIFVVVSALEFAYSRAPTGMKGAGVGLVYTAMGFAALISFIAIETIEEHKPDLFYRQHNPSPPHVYMFFAALGGIMLLGLGVFHCMAKRGKLIPVRARQYTNANASSEDTLNGSIITSFA